MGTAVHPVTNRVKKSFKFLTSGHSDAQPWVSECPDVKNYKWRLNLIWLYPSGCTRSGCIAVPIGNSGRRRATGLAALIVQKREVFSCPLKQSKLVERSRRSSVSEFQGIRSGRRRPYMIRRKRGVMRRRRQGEHRGRRAATS